MISKGQAIVMDDAEREVFDLIIEVMHGIQVKLGITANGAELGAAVHVLQGFVVQHMLHRLDPETWNDWSDS